MKKKKLFVLDTNVPLHDSNCCSSFEEHDIAIPIEVIEEIDHFKKGLEPINYNAREFIRFLDKLPPDKTFDGGADLGKDLGKIKIILDHPYHGELKKIFNEKTVDHKIINSVYCLSRERGNENVEVILVSKDGNLRLKARALGLKAEDYKTDSVSNVDTLYKKAKTIIVEEEIIDNLYKNETVDFDPKENVLNENEFIILNSCSKKTALALYGRNQLRFITKDNVSSFGIKPKNSEQAFALSVLLDPKITLITMIGQAGTGKTLLSLAGSLQQLEEKKYEKVFFTRNTVPLGRDVGFLPGDINEKVSPYMRGFSDNLSFIKNISKYKTRIDKFTEEGKLHMEPIPFLRGSSMPNVIFIIDEAQNLTPKEVKAIVTRAGEGTKIILIGDITQIDDPYLDERSNGLSYLIEKMSGQDFYAHVVFVKSERSRLAEIAGNLL